MGAAIQNNSTQQTYRIITGWRFQLLELGLLGWAVRRAFQLYPQKNAALKALKKQIKEHLDYKNTCHFTKAVRMEGRTFFHSTFPSKGSKAGLALLDSELLRHVAVDGRKPGLNILMLAVTKKCSLQCAHCYEWDNLNGREQLSVDDLASIISRFQENGAATVELCGGEPMNRFDELVEVLHKSDTVRSEFWMITSGFKLTEQRALALRDAGLTGVGVSLDHWDAPAHDRFRGMAGSFDWARTAIKNAQTAGLMTCLNLTAVRDFCKPEHLWKYAELSMQWHVPFIRIFEPSATGHFAGKDVELRNAELEVLENFVKTIQNDKAYRNHPIVDYYGPHQRKTGCSGAGKRYLYVDTDGDVLACPFCRKKSGNALQNDVSNIVSGMISAGACQFNPTH